MTAEHVCRRGGMSEARRIDIPRPSVRRHGAGHDMLYEGL